MGAQLIHAQAEREQAEAKRKQVVAQRKQQRRISKARAKPIWLDANGEYTPGVLPDSMGEPQLVGRRLPETYDLVSNGNGSSLVKAAVVSTGIVAGILFIACAVKRCFNKKQQRDS